MPALASFIRYVDATRLVTLNVTQRVVKRVTLRMRDSIYVVRSRWYAYSQLLLDGRWHASLGVLRGCPAIIAVYVRDCFEEHTRSSR